MWREVADRAEVLQHVLRVAAEQHRVVPEPVGDAVDPPRRVGVGVRRAGRHHRVGVEGDGHLDVAAGGRSECVDGQAVAEQEVVRGGHRRARLGATRRVDAGRVAEHRRAPGLVDRGPVVDAVAEGGADHRRVLGEPRRRCRRSGQPPWSSRACGRSQWYRVATGLDPGREELVDEGPVEVEPALAHRAAARRHHPRPRRPRTGRPRCRATAISATSSGMRWRWSAASGRRRRPRTAPGVAQKRVPDRRAAAVEVGAPLDLEGGGGGAPEEVGGEHGPGRSRHRSAGRDLASSTPVPGAAPRGGRRGRGT